MKPRGQKSRLPLAYLAVCGLLWLSLAPSSVEAGAWTQPAGRAYGKVWVQGLIGGLAYMEGSPSEPVDGLYTDFSLNLYLEYGLTDWMTIVLLGRPIGHAAFDGEAAPVGRRQGSTAYLGPIGGGFRFGLPLGRLKTAIELHYIYASTAGEVEIGSGLVPSGKRWSYTPVVSTHRLEAELQLGLGFSFGKGYHGWLSLSPGLRYHTRASLGAAFYGMFQFGVQMPFGLVLDLHFNLYFPFEEIVAFNISGAGNTRYIGFGLTASYWITRSFALTAALEGVFLAYSNAATPTLILGVEFRIP